MSFLRISKGMGLVEVVIALFLATVAVLAVFSLQSKGLQTTARSDYLGRAAEILEQQLESTEAYVMNLNNSAAITGIPAIPGAGGSLTAYHYVITSGFGVAINGDATYYVSTTITGVAPVPPNPNTTPYYRVDVNVTWPLNPTGISQTIFVSRQDAFRQSSGI